MDTPAQAGAGSLMCLGSGACRRARDAPSSAPLDREHPRSVDARLFGAEPAGIAKDVAGRQRFKAFADLAERSS
jgi:hypothetical protein